MTLDRPQPVAAISGRGTSEVTHPTPQEARSACRRGHLLRLVDRYRVLLDCGGDMVAERVRCERVFAHDRAHEGMADRPSRFRRYGVLPDRCVLRAPCRQYRGALRAKGRHGGGDVGAGRRRDGNRPCARAVANLCVLRVDGDRLCRAWLDGTFDNTGAMVRAASRAGCRNRPHGRERWRDGRRTGAAARDCELRLPSGNRGSRMHCARGHVAAHSAGSAPAAPRPGAASRRRSVPSCGPTLAADRACVRPMRFVRGRSLRSSSRSASRLRCSSPFSHIMLR